MGLELVTVDVEELMEEYRRELTFQELLEPQKEQESWNKEISSSDDEQENNDSLASAEIRGRKRKLLSRKTQ